MTYKRNQALNKSEISWQKAEQNIEKNKDKVQSPTSTKPTAYTWR